MKSIPLLKSFDSDQIVLVLSAHCDDAGIGCGALLRRLVQEAANPQIIGVVFSGGDDLVRKEEEKIASRAFGMSKTEIYSYPDSLLPNHWHEVKRDLLRLREEIGKDRVGLVLCPRLDDRHQDHKVVAENAWRVFRDHIILEFEIHKYEGDLGRPNLYVSLTEEQAQEKADLLLRSYPSRACHHWWSREAFIGLMKLRGIEANVAYAEGFTARKMLF